MPLYRFGAFEFDSKTGELRGTGRGEGPASDVRLRPQPARALEHLLARHGEFVSRGELQRTLWPDGTFVHFEYGLNSCIKQIRAALGDSRSAPTYIETLVKRGFRFIAPVSVVCALSRPGSELPGRRQGRTADDPGEAEGTELLKSTPAAAAVARAARLGYPSGRRLQDASSPREGPRPPVTVLVR
jgi:DNA-binding winged helix-turn-helix (wHTH) protein